VVWTSEILTRWNGINDSFCDLMGVHQRRDNGIWPLSPSYAESGIHSEVICHSNELQCSFSLAPRSRGPLSCLVRLLWTVRSLAASKERVRRLQCTLVAVGSPILCPGPRGLRVVLWEASGCGESRDMLHIILIGEADKPCWVRGLFGN
jgi:hypothetical protein